jgi:hypothetical protein
MRKNTFHKGDTVKVGTGASIPLRYQGRTATVVGRKRYGRGFRTFVDFGTRRATPLLVPLAQLTLV